MNPFKQERSPARKAIELVLSQATPERPLTPAYIARLTGLSLVTTSKYVHAAVTNGDAYRVAGTRGEEYSYAWGQPVAEAVPTNLALPRMREMAAKPWQPAKFTPPRAGCMDAYDIPSLGDTERRRPILIGSQPDRGSVHAWSGRG